MDPTQKLFKLLQQKKRGPNFANEVRSLIVLGAKVDDWCPKTNESPLSLAAKMNNIEVVRILISSLPPDHVPCRRSLSYAIEVGNLEMVQLLRGYHSDDGIMTKSIEHGHIDLVRHFAKIWNQNLFSLLPRAASSGQNGLIRALLKEEPLCSQNRHAILDKSLCNAIEKSHKRTVIILLSAGANPTSPEGIHFMGNSPIKVACSRVFKNTEILSLLLDWIKTNHRLCWDPPTKVVDDALVHCFRFRCSLEPIKLLLLHGACPFSSELFGRYDGWKDRSFAMDLLKEAKGMYLLCSVDSYFSLLPKSTLHKICCSLY